MTAAATPTAPAADLGEQLAARTGGVVSQEYGGVTVDVPAGAWLAALTAARDELGLRFFDWLSAVDELENGFAVVCHLVDPDTCVHLLVRTRVRLENPRLASATAVFGGASWHERETWEMFGIDFAGHPNLVPLLLPDGFVGRPLRKEFVLAARTERPWPGAKGPAK
jgi:NADH-quinone oxidoreductase subunit C